MKSRRANTTRQSSPAPRRARAASPRHPPPPAARVVAAATASRLDGRDVPTCGARRRSRAQRLWSSSYASPSSKRQRGASVCRGRYIGRGYEVWQLIGRSRQRCRATATERGAGMLSRSTARAVLYPCCVEQRACGVGERPAGGHGAAQPHPPVMARVPTGGGRAPLPSSVRNGAAGGAGHAAPLAAAGASPAATPPPTPFLRRGGARRSTPAGRARAPPSVALAAARP